MLLLNKEYLLVLLRKLLNLWDCLSCFNSRKTSVTGENTFC